MQQAALLQRLISLLPLATLSDIVLVPSTAGDDVRHVQIVARARAPERLLKGGSTVRPCVSTVRQQFMDKLVLQAAEEVALEGPEGENWSEYFCSINLRLQTPARLPQAVLHVSFGSC